LQKIKEAEVLDDVSKGFQAFILAEMDRRFTPVEDVQPIALATVLDPRFKKLYFSSPAAFAKAANFIAREVKEAMTSEAAEAAQQVDECRKNSGAGDSLWSDHDELVARSIAASVDDFGVVYPLELRQYLAKPISPSNEDPLVLWEGMKHEFPHLYKLQSRYLPMLGTSVASERLFSKAGLIVTDLTSRLTPEHVSQRLFLATVSPELWRESST